MVDKKGGFRRKTRTKLKKQQSKKGKISISDFLQELSVNDRVCLKMEPAYQKGVYDPKFYGLTAIVTGKKGKCYSVKINHRGQEKTLIVHPVHLKKL
jgi:large subunit ribosomal protein L21e